jgi:hypothetical protein
LDKYAMMQLLIDYGADVNKAFGPGRGLTTLLDVVYELNDGSIAIFLLDRGAHYKRLRMRTDEQRPFINSHIRLLSARHQRALHACCALRSALKRSRQCPRDLQLILMRLIWNERRSYKWDR